MEVASLTSEWTAVVITGVGLLGLIAQAGSIRSSIDPFGEARTPAFLGPWTLVQPKSPWYSLSSGVPLGPALYGDRDDGFCGTNLIFLSRKATVGHGRASWSILLACFHNPKGGLPERFLSAPTALLTDEKNVVVTRFPEHVSQEMSWNGIPLTEMIKHQEEACIPINRKVLIICFMMASARQIWRYAGSSGYRAAFTSYNGLYNVDLPLGGKATVTFSAHDSHKPVRDAHPTFFTRRVDKCIDMLAGVVVGESTGFTIAFPGREEPGEWVLHWQKLGYSAHYGSRNLYSIMGGDDYKIHKLVQRKYDPDDQLLKPTASDRSQSTQTDLSGKTIVPTPSRGDPTVHTVPLVLSLPSLQPEQKVTLYVYDECIRQLALAMDNLPWTPLQWAIHRGMQDILLAYGKPTMQSYRLALAETLKLAVPGIAKNLIKQGWKASFVNETMADNVFVAIMAGSGGSGDTVRVVTAVVRELCAAGKPEGELDCTSFWANNLTKGRASSGASSVSSKDPIKAPDTQLEHDTIVALTKYFVLE